MDTGFEPVESVAVYYDGPRIGVAQFRGILHRFRALGWQWAGDDNDPSDWDGTTPLDDDRFELTPVDSGTSSVVVRGEFRVRQPCPELPAGVIRPLEVRWTPISSQSAKLPA